MDSYAETLLIYNGKIKHIGAPEKLTILCGFNVGEEKVFYFIVLPDESAIFISFNHDTHDWEEAGEVTKISKKYGSIIEDYFN